MTRHRVRRAVTAAVLLTSLVAVCGPVAAQHHNQHDERALREDPRLAPDQIAPVLEGLGDHHHAVTTSSERAQLFFDQGLKLTYGFNHQEALRSFKEAARLDPDCAMAYWGWALVLGPNLNLPMRDDVVGQAAEAIRMAQERRHLVSERERAYIDALAARYSADPGADRAALDQAYADAMRAVHEADPLDTDAATLYAAALMNTMPWNYWTRDGRPRPKTEIVVSTLEAALEIDPEHEGALHYYIHIMEPVNPEGAVWVADRLRGLAPGAGHLLHMPSHIDMQVGRYAEAYDANVRAAEADEGYITQCRAQGIYPLNYYPHNVHFLVWAAMMQGRRDEALAAARKVADGVPDDMHGNDWALYQTFMAMPLSAMARFGQWDAILAEPEPAEELVFLRGVRHYARGLAYARTGDTRAAKRELKSLRRLMEDPAADADLVGFTNAASLLDLAAEIVAGEIDAASGKYDSAVAHLDRATRLEDAQLYTEPPAWFYPVRHTLGAVLLEAGRPAEAEVVYWQDLHKNVDNGWALHGLWKSLNAQGRLDEADAIKARLDEAWADASVRLTSSRL